MPFFEVTKPGFFYGLHRHHDDNYVPSFGQYRASAVGLIIMTDHSGTHVDAKCHMSYNLKLYGDISVEPSIQTSWGFTKYGAEEIPIMVAKGVLLDVANLLGLDPLPSTKQITAEDLEACCKEEGVNVTKGDVVLIRTGSGRFWYQPEVYKNSAGVSKDADVWLINKGVLAVGIDNLTWDPHGVKDEETGITMFGHYLLLVKNGIYILENLYLEGLHQDKCYEFIFVAAPLKFKGATGAPLRPIALSPLKFG